VSISARRGAPRSRATPTTSSLYHRACNLMHNPLHLCRPDRFMEACSTHLLQKRSRFRTQRIACMAQGAGDAGFIIDGRDRIGTCGVGRQDLVPGGIWKGAAPRHDGRFHRKDGPLSGMALDARRAPVLLNDAAAERASGECLCHAAVSPWRHWHEHCPALCCE
jgi:hypothetical protein